MLFALCVVACLGGMTLLFRRCCFYAGRVYINPVLGLLMGLFYYVLLPGSFIYYFSDLIDEWTAYGAELSKSNAQLVMMFTVALLVALNLGAHFWRATKPRYPATPHDPADRGAIGPTRWTRGASWPATFTMAACILLFVALTITVRGSLFSGYAADVLADDSVWAARAGMSSAYSMFYVSMCVYIVRRRRKTSSAVRWALIVSFGFCSLILLSMGARLYVAMALLSLLALKSTLSNGIPMRQLTAYLLSGVLLMGSVGVLRSGSVEGVQSIANNVMLEPLLTSISLYTLLTDNAPIWIGQVHMFLADFEAVLPSALFPNKSRLFDRLDTYGYSFASPVGGYHLYFSGLINFGYLGMVLIAVWAGYVLARVSRRPLEGPIRTSTLVTGAYLTGALTFTVFRDPFFIAIAKNVLINGVILPIVLASFKGRLLPSRAIPASHDV